MTDLAGLQISKKARQPARSLRNTESVHFSMAVLDHLVQILMAQFVASRLNCADLKAETEAFTLAVAFEICDNKRRTAGSLEFLTS